MSKIGILTARIPPVRCGVGDHTVNLAEALTKKGAVVEVVTAAAQASSVPGTAFTVKNVVPSWSWRGMRDLFRHVKAAEYDVLVVQWVPHLYHPLGMALALPFTLSLLAAKGVRIHLMVHEPWVSFTSPKLILPGLIQRFAMGLLLKASPKVGVSIEAWTSLLKDKFPRFADRIHNLPVFSNIPVVENPQLTESLRSGIPSNAHILGIFSLAGSGKMYPFIEAAWERILDSNENAFFVMVGASEEEAKKYLPHLRLQERCRFTGFLRPEEVSAWLQVMDVMVAPFVDGVSSRRTSVLAALAHGVPVLTTRGRLSDRVFLEDGPLVLSHLDKDAFSNELVALLQDEIRRRKLAALAKPFYEKHFSIERVAGFLAGTKTDSPQRNLRRGETL